MSEYQLEATIPTVQFGNLHVQTHDLAALLELLRDENLDAVIDELRLIDADQNVKNAGLVGGSTSEEPAAYAENEAPTVETNANRRAKATGGYGRAKQESRAREGGQAPTCDHGKVMKFRSSSTGGRDGNGYKGWFCQATRDRDDQCKPIFFD